MKNDGKSFSLSLFVRRHRRRFDMNIHVFRAAIVHVWMGQRGSFRWLN
jgi:hypothetical protein